MTKPSVQNAPKQRLGTARSGFDPEGFVAYKKPPARIAGGVLRKRGKNYDVWAVIAYRRAVTCGKFDRFV